MVHFRKVGGNCIATCFSSARRLQRHGSTPKDKWFTPSLAFFPCLYLSVFVFVWGGSEGVREGATEGGRALPVYDSQ